MNIGYFLNIDIELCTHSDKKNYAVHIRNIKEVLEHGLKLVFAFYQEAWLKPYIEMNTEF